jgi:hypothetical protein
MASLTQSRISLDGQKHKRVIGRKSPLTHEQMNRFLAGGSRCLPNVFHCHSTGHPMCGGISVTVNSCAFSRFVTLCPSMPERLAGLREQIRQPPVAGVIFSNFD